MVIGDARRPDAQKMRAPHSIVEMRQVFHGYSQA